MWTLKRSILTGCLLMFAACFPLLAQADTSWSWANPVPQGNPLNASVTGSGTSVAVGNGGIVYASSGGTWLTQTSGTTSNLYAVTFGGGVFVAVGANGTIITSPNGIDWTAAVNGTAAQDLNTVAYGNGIFIAAGTNGVVFASSNGGATWQAAANLGDAISVTATVFGNGRFVAIARNTVTHAGTIFYTADAATWHGATVPANVSDAPVYGAFDGSLFLALGANADGHTGASVLTSNDGINWTAQASLLPATSVPFALTANGSLFVVLLEPAASDTAVTTPVGIETSSDGSSWITLGANDLPASWSQHIPRQLSYTGSAYLVVGASAYLATSINLVNWIPASPVTALTLNRLRGIEWLNNRFFAVGDDDTILTSANGVDWNNQAVTVATRSNLRDIAYNGKRFVIVGSNNIVLTSTDGASWSVIRMQPESPAGTVFTGVDWNGSVFAAVGTGGVVYSSPDGLNWTPRTSGTQDNLWGVVWSGEYFVAVSDSVHDNTPIIISSDGSTWIAATFYADNPVALYGVHWDGLRMIVSGSATMSDGRQVGFMATSTDCFCWATYNADVQDVFSDATFNGNQFIAVGRSTLYTSEDGIHWTAPTPSIQGVELQKLAAYNGQLVSTGYAGAILHSTTLVPTVNDGTVDTKVNNPVNGTLHAYGSNLIFSVSQPAHGTLTLTDAATGAFTYTPTSGYSGSDQFTFTASSSAGTSNTATEIITVNDIPPSAHDGTSSVATGRTLYGQMTASAAYDGQQFTYQLVTNPSHGSIVLTNPWNGSFSYTPADGFIGTDSFEFNTIDEAGTTSNTATQQITVSATPLPTADPTSGSGDGASGGGGSAGILALALLAFAWRLRCRL